jgi:hypothetical protein
LQDDSSGLGNNNSENSCYDYENDKEFYKKNCKLYVLHNTLLPYDYVISIVKEDYLDQKLEPTQGQLFLNLALTQIMGPLHDSFGYMLYVYTDEPGGTKFAHVFVSALVDFGESNGEKVLRMVCYPKKEMVFSFLNEVGETYDATLKTLLPTADLSVKAYNFNFSMWRNIRLPCNYFGLEDCSMEKSNIDLNCMEVKYLSYDESS